MRTLTLMAPGRLEWSLEGEPDPLPGEALVRVTHVGVCGSDLHAFNGRQPFFAYPRRLGHELAVEVISAPELAPGTRCAVDPYLNCHECASCRRGDTNCCENLRVLGIHCDGGHAPLLALPEGKLRASATLSAETLALVEPLVIGRHAVRRGAIAAGESAAIVGLGPIGVAVALYAAAGGADLALVDTREDRREAARRLLGADRVFAAGQGLEAQLRNCFGGDLPRIVFDATGSAAAMHASFDLVGHGGRCVFVGHYIGAYSFHEPDFHRRELTLLASRNGRKEDFDSVLQSLENGSVDVAGYITHRFAFSEAPGRFPELQGTQGLVKAMITLG